MLAEGMVPLQATRTPAGWATMRPTRTHAGWAMMRPTRTRTGRVTMRASIRAMDLRRIINADQTPLFVEMPAGRTLEQKGSRSVPVKTAGYEKQRLTVMLACTASGDKLRPWVWFKRKTIPKCECPSGRIASSLPTFRLGALR
ncbi:hypothetical protein CLOP_g18373 [Closterium sp. NIES-67]|nr:hypothetical protein CLOP_g18373 [Closterium sp. NIES-67]